MRTFQIRTGDALAELAKLPDESVQCCVTSPPYWGLRDYGVSGQLGLEKTPEEYVAKMVRVFAEVRRVLRNDGTLWLNIGDSYMGGGRGGGAEDCKQRTNVGSLDAAPNQQCDGYKAKDLCGIPWLLAFALRADGWYLRQDIIWSKPNPMPESVRDRCTKAHEYIFLLTKSARYFYDADAVAEASADATAPRLLRGQESLARIGGVPGQSAHALHQPRKRNDRFGGNKHNGDTTKHSDGSVFTGSETRNKRSVWEVTTQPYPEAHFATFPPEIPEICIAAGSREGDTILDPFSGAGTTGLVATRMNRNYIGIELNPKYVEMAEKRIREDAPLLNSRPTEGSAGAGTQIELGSGHEDAQ